MTKFNDRIARAAKDNGWVLLRKGDSWSPSRSGRSVIVGYAPWSGPDVGAVLQLVKRRDLDAIAVLVVDDLDDVWSLDVLMPSVPRPTMTPIAAEYRHGAWAAFAQGQAAFDLLRLHS